MKNKLSDKQIIKSFLYTVEEYKRFAKSLSTEKTHSLLDTYTEVDYIGIQTKRIPAFQIMSFYFLPKKLTAIDFFQLHHISFLH